MNDVNVNPEQRNELGNKGHSDIGDLCVLSIYRMCHDNDNNV